MSYINLVEKSSIADKSMSFPKRTDNAGSCSDLPNLRCCLV